LERVHRVYAADETGCVSFLQEPAQHALDVETIGVDRGSGRELTEQRHVRDVVAARLREHLQRDPADGNELSSVEVSEFCAHLTVEQVAERGQALLEVAHERRIDRLAIRSLGKEQRVLPTQENVVGLAQPHPRDGPPSALSRCGREEDWGSGALLLAFPVGQEGSASGSQSSMPFYHVSVAVNSRGSATSRSVT